MTRQRWHTAILALLLMLAFGGVWATQVAAHAKLKASFPARDATIGAAPAQVLLTFSEETSPTKSGGSVSDATGATVSTGFRVNLTRRTEMTIDLRMALPPGAYTVKYNTFTEDDSGAEQGTFAFTVREGAPVPTAPPTTTSTVADTPPTDGGIPTGVWVLLGVAVLGVGAFAARLFALRRPQTGRGR